MLTVTKFGGSSLSCANQFIKVKSIIESNHVRKVVVVSALGKRSKDDSKITDLLYLLHAHLKYSVPYEGILKMIEDRFYQIKKDLNLNFDLEQEFFKIKKLLNKETAEDFLVSRGEYLTAKLMAEFLNYAFLDAKDLICFNYDGSINNDITQKNIENEYYKVGNFVIPGFYGAYPNHTIRLMPRGGSDITGSIVAKALNASMYENWTDVPGILMADPRIIKNPKKVNQITYSELRELSYMGANVLHEETIYPVQGMNIPINILNTNDPNSTGTIITKNCDDSSQIITGIAGKKNFTVFTITKTHSGKKVSLIRKCLEIFESYRVGVEHIPSSIDSFSIVVNTEDVEKCLYNIVNDIQKEPGVMDIKVEDEIALVAVVGRNMVTRIGISGIIFGIIGSSNINIKMIAQGSNELNIIVAVSNVDFENTIKALYEKLVN